MADSGVPSSSNARSYDAFGAVRNGDLSNRAGGTLNLGDTRHGFTQHEHADDVRLIHMGGRIYDYTLGRFLNVDPVIQNWCCNHLSRLKAKRKIRFEMAQSLAKISTASYHDERCIDRACTHCDTVARRPAPSPLLRRGADRKAAP